jgi:hypothetical protein
MMDTEVEVIEVEEVLEVELFKCFVTQILLVDQPTFQEVRVEEHLEQRVLMVVLEQQIRIQDIQVKI